MKLYPERGLKAGITVLSFYIFVAIFGLWLDESRWPLVVLFAGSMTFLTAKWLFRREVKDKKLNGEIEDVLGSLYDPEEILEQTSRNRILKWVNVFEKTDYKEIAKEYSNFVNKKKFDFSKLPSDPGEIEIEFRKRYLKIFGNK